ncbi:MAG: tetratricopeptide repeat protein [Candidatus Obscuribacterales bacterium]|nr:tetratricopeptide repeat protein [Candidatus Obscuribacterales bacterium]
MQNLNSIIVAIVFSVLLLAAPIFHLEAVGAEPAKSNSVKQGSALPAGKFADKWSLVVGLGSFQSSKLRGGARLDKAAHDLAEQLVENQGFSDDHVLLLTNEEAGKDSLLSALSDGWLTSLAGKDDLVVVFINTLCFPANDKEVYLCAYDTDLDNFYSTSIRASDLLARLESKLQAKNVVLVFQTIFTGAPEMVLGCKTEFGKYNVDFSKTQLPANYAILSSSRPNQPTWGAFFSDSLIKVMASEKADQFTIDKFFKLVHDDTVSSIIIDCTGCKIQTPVLYKKASSAALPAAYGLKTVPVAARPVPLKSEALADGEAVRKLASRVYTFLRHGKNELALSAASTAYDSHAQDPAVNYLLGLALSLSGDSQKAVAKFARAAQLRPDNSIYLSRLARALSENGQPAYEKWKAAYRTDPLNYEAVEALSDEESSRGQYASAVKILNTALRAFPDNAFIHGQLSYVLGKSGQTKLALQHAHEAVILDDSSFTMFMHLGSLLLANGRTNEAQAAFRQALSLVPETSEGYYVLAMALEKTRDSQGALEALKKFISVSKPGDKRLGDARDRVSKLENSDRR